MIKRMRRILLPVLLMCPVLPLSASASINTDAMYTPSSIVNIAILLCAIICLAWAMKILSLVRGGLLSKSWQMFVLGFCFLIFAQLMVIGEHAELFMLPSYTTTSLYLLMAITWLIGLYHTRKILG